MAFTRWLRRNSEHYLLVGAQERIARAQGANRPRPPKGVKDWFWLRVFAPAYRVLPWSLRRRVLHVMPGSHRRSWSPPPKPLGPAV